MMEILTSRLDGGKTTLPTVSLYSEPLVLLGVLTDLHADN